MRVFLSENVPIAINEIHSRYGWIYLFRYGIRHFKFSSSAAKGQHAEDYPGYPVRW